MVKNPAIFFDRDGVLTQNVFYKKYNNYEAPLKPKDLKYKKHLKILNHLSKKYFLFIITNQPAAAKKKTSVKNLKLINNLFLNKLKQKKIDIKELLVCYNDYSSQKNLCKKLYYCKKKKNNICRKPSNKLINYCIKKYNVDVKKSYFIGDRKSDYIASKKSKLKFIYLIDKENLKIDYIKKINNLKELIIL